MLFFFPLIFLKKFTVMKMINYEMLRGEFITWEVVYFSFVCLWCHNDVILCLKVVSFN